jgi:two-component system alkaline phosphatase synthesis response regulator PhoP
MVEDDSTIEIHGIVIDPARRKVSVEGRLVTLTNTEFLLLWFLAGRPGVAHTRQQIIDAIQGPAYPVTPRSIDVQVVGLRKKLGDFGRLLETVRGVGYRFRE